MNEWHDLFIATAGASAALTGLLFVGISINLTRILSIPHLTNRALLSLVFQATILIISIDVLIPKETFAAAGIGILVIGFCCWLFTLYIDISIFKNIEKKFKRLKLINFIIDQVAIFQYIIASCFLLQERESGLYWVASAVIFSFIKSIADAWVFLIEINR